jgi:hypothetical protein
MASIVVVYVGTGSTGSKYSEGSLNQRRDASASGKIVLDLLQNAARSIWISGRAGGIKRVYLPAGFDRRIYVF